MLLFLHWMQESHVNWDAVDFIVFGAMLASVAVATVLVVRLTGSRAYRFAVAAALAAAFFLLWVNGAVGIIGDEGNDANMMFFGVLAVALLGAVIARFRPRGMMLAMLSTAIAQVAVALSIWLRVTPK